MFPIVVLLKRHTTLAQKSSPTSTFCSFKSPCMIGLTYFVCRYAIPDAISWAILVFTGIDRPCSALHVWTNDRKVINHHHKFSFAWQALNIQALQPSQCKAFLFICSCDPIIISLIIPVLGLSFGLLLFILPSMTSFNSPSHLTTCFIKTPFPSSILTTFFQPLSDFYKKIGAQKKHIINYKNM